MFLFFSLAASYNLGPNVLSLTSSRFTRDVDKRANASVWFVMFHGEHCPACRQAYPEFKEAAAKAAGMVHFGEVDTGSEYMLANRFRIQQIPTFYIFHRNGQTQFAQYPDSRSMLNAASSRIPSLAVDVNESWLNTTDLRATILFTEKLKAPPIWAAISCNFSGTDIQVGITTNPKLQSLFGIDRVPTILMMDGSKRLVYKGKVAYQNVLKTLGDFFTGKVTPTPAPTAATFTRKLRGTEDFRKQCKGKGVFCVVGAGGPEFEAMAKHYRNDKFRFWVCGDGCEAEFAKRGGIWILHHRREAAIWTERIEGLGGILDRVIDGGAVFTPMEKLLKAEQNL